VCFATPGAELGKLDRMIRIEIDAVRSRYEAAFELYRVHALKLIERSKGGQQPSPQELAAEERALHELTRVRRELLDALAQGLRQR
jgi:hypothetical protein